MSRHLQGVNPARQVTYKGASPALQGASTGGEPSTSRHPQGVNPGAGGHLLPRWVQVPRRAGFAVGEQAKPVTGERGPTGREAVAGERIPTGREAWAVRPLGCTHFGADRLVLQPRLVRCLGAPCGPLGPLLPPLPPPPLTLGFQGRRGDPLVRGGGGGQVRDGAPLTLTAEGGKYVTVLSSPAPCSSP